MAGSFVPALIVVDVQEDFCPPNGSLAVPDGRAVVSSINVLLALPFKLKVATRDWHPPGHVSFASGHAGAQPYTSRCRIVNPANPSETYESQLWPDHCVQDTAGAELVPELEASKIHRIINKGTMPQVEMYSAFYPPLVAPRVGDSGLADLLQRMDITHVYVVGLAGDYCVKYTALDAVVEGYTTYVVREATRPVDVHAWEDCVRELEGRGVSFIAMDAIEVTRVKAS